MKRFKLNDGLTQLMFDSYKQCSLVLSQLEAKALTGTYSLIRYSIIVEDTSLAIVDEYLKYNKI